MGTTATEIMNLMTTGLSLNDIKANLALEDKMFLSALKEIRSNYQNFDKKFYDNGTVFYLPEEPKVILPPNKIELLSTKDTFRAIFISDLHCGNKRQRLDLLNVVYEYAAKNNIYIIINTGDVLENIYSIPQSELKQKTVEGQINSLIRNHPYAPNIINLILYGNHDYKALTDQGIDVAAIIEQERYDLVSLGYGEAFIKTKEDEI